MAPVFIQNLKRKPKAKDKIEVKVKDSENNEVTRYLPICTVEDSLEFTIDLILKALTIERQDQVPCAINWASTWKRSKQ